MTFNQPPGWAERATYEDESAPHQVRINLTDNKIWLSCTCRSTGRGIAGHQEYTPICYLGPEDDAIEKWRKFHKAEGIEV